MQRRNCGIATFRNRRFCRIATQWNRRFSAYLQKPTEKKVKDKRNHKSNDNTLALGHYFEHKEVTFTSEDDYSLNNKSLLCPGRKEVAKWLKGDEDTKVHQKQIEDEHVSKKRRSFRRINKRTTTTSGGQLYDSTDSCKKNPPTHIQNQ
jgi:hypothetical protein